MKKLNIGWEKGVYDPTGYLFSFAKSLATSLKHSSFLQDAEDVIATSGFAFRIWVDGKTMCPSATSIFDFGLLKYGVNNAGYECDYVSRLWGEDAVEEERRNQAKSSIKASIDNGIAPIVWDIGVPEWGLITGYDDDKQVYFTLAVNNQEGEMPYDILGRRELPLLSVTCPTGRTNKDEKRILMDTLRIALNHARGGEWCDNKKGLEAFEAFAALLDTERFNPDSYWNVEYYLGTYAALRYYAWKYIEKMAGKYPKLTEIANGYRKVYENLKEAFDLKMANTSPNESILSEMASKVRIAGEEETICIESIEESLSL